MQTAGLQGWREEEEEEEEGQQEARLRAVEPSTLRGPWRQNKHSRAHMMKRRGGGKTGLQAHDVRAGH